MRIVTYEPRNAEASGPGEPFVRSHFAAPEIDAKAWRLRIGFARDLSLDDVTALPQREIAAVLECAGNGRTRYRPLPKGTPWGDGAVSCARYRGASLADALGGRARIPDGTVELVFAGADAGDVDGRRTRYERSLPLDVAMRPDVLLCHEMDGAPLARDHGAPVRLLVPGWYGVASVKWLADVRAATGEPFRGYYQEKDYVYKPRQGDITPVRRLRVKSTISAPEEGARVRTGENTRIQGLAWSGEAPVARVDVSTDGGQSWSEARLDAADSPYAWRAWSIEWTPRKAGDVLVCARARDEAGGEQPWEPEWNALGYGWNAIPVRRLHVEAVSLQAE